MPSVVNMPGKSKRKALRSQLWASVRSTPALRTSFRPQMSGLTDLLQVTCLQAPEARPPIGCGLFSAPFAQLGLGPPLGGGKGADAMAAG